MTTDANLLALWGDLFEIAVKRGVLAHLQHAGLIPAEHPALRPWQDTPVYALHRHMLGQLGATDDNYLAQVRSACDHLLLGGYGLGWTCLREYLRRRGPGLKLHALFCPLTLRDRTGGTFDFAADESHALEQFFSALSLAGPPDPAMAARGAPARADFLLLTRAPRGDVHLLCLEFSMNVPAEPGAFAAEPAHLDEIERYARSVEGRGVFSRISAEVSGEGFALSEGLLSHLSAFTSSDKPLYKLCQGCSYVTTLIPLLRGRGHIGDVIHAQVLAVTAAGLEGVSATFPPRAAVEPRAALMRSLGAAYRRGYHSAGGEDALSAEIQAVYDQIARSLPASLRAGLAHFLSETPAGAPVQARLSEAVSEFVNPNQPLPRDRCLSFIDDDPTVAALLGGPPRETIGRTLRDLGRAAGSMSLRSLHEAAVLAGLQGARRGQINVLALEGHPGIGKTTAIIRLLEHQASGFLFAYVSPRIVINADVTDKLARRGAAPSGVLTLTTNSVLIGGVRRWLEANPAAREGRGFVDGAVVADGVAGFLPPTGSIVFLNPEQAQDIDENHGSAGLRKTDIDERLALIHSQRPPGVLRTLATAARTSLQANPTIDRLVITAAIQGYREVGEARTTLQGLSKLFLHPADSPRGLAERLRLAARTPTILFMVDELAGDGAGAPLLHGLADWLHEQFIAPFSEDPEGSPFTVVLIIADASLGNEVVLSRYLEAQGQAPDKVLVSRSAGPRPFRLAAGPLRLGSLTCQALHVMADSYPAGNLTVDYCLRLMPIVRAPRADGTLQSPREAIRSQAGEQQLQSAVEEIVRAARQTPEQVIFFAQDKLLLREVRRRLGADAELRQAGVRPEDIEVLDSSVPPGVRRHLIRPEVRDRKKIFLMTSSGSRGVSFPRATQIIALVPRFSVESGLMEIAQLIYRGRGFYCDPVTNEERSGDDFDRRLVMVINDFLIDEGPEDRRRRLRQSVDLVTLLVLLRATILTRIRGDAAIPGQPLAVVPVGGVGVDDLGQTMSEQVRDLLREASVYLASGGEPERAGRAARARDLTQELFSALDWSGRVGDRHHRSLTDPETLQHIVRQVTAAPLPLLPPQGGPTLPPQVHCVGPLWLEDWSEIPTTESFTFEVWDRTLGAQYGDLVAILGHIKDDHAYPTSLRRPARDLHRILLRERQAREREYAAAKEVGDRRVFVALPLDYPRFCYRSEAGERPMIRPLDEPAFWLQALQRAVSASSMPSALLPVIPRFRDKPFVAIVARGDPTDMDRALDPRYFMASTELNLLNALLFTAGPES